MICLISWPLLIASRRDWYQSKGLLKGFKLALRPWEFSKNWWRYDQMKFVTTTREICILALSLCQHLISSYPLMKGPVEIFSKVISKVEVLRLLFALVIRVQRLGRVQGFKSKRILHKNCSNLA